MINVMFVRGYAEEYPQGSATVVLSGQPGEVIGSSFFSPPSSGPEMLPRIVVLSVRTKGFKTGFNNPRLEDVTVREVPLDSVSIFED